MIKSTITYKSVKPFVEAIKEVGRVVLLGIIPIIIMGINSSTGEIVINWKIVVATTVTLILTALLKGVDKDLHLEQKILPKEEQNKGILGVKGLTGF